MSAQHLMFNFHIMELQSNPERAAVSQWRKRAPSACVHCRKAHACCGFERPCQRCVRLDLQCVEAVQKKRGRKKKTKGGNSTTLTTTATGKGTGTAMKPTLMMLDSEKQQRKQRQRQRQRQRQTQRYIPQTQTRPKRTSIALPGTGSVLPSPQQRDSGHHNGDDVLMMPWQESLVVSRALVNCAVSSANNVFGKQSVGILVSTSVPHVDFANSFIMEKWGYSPTETIGTWFDLLHPSSITNAAAEYVSLAMEEVRRRIMNASHGEHIPTRRRCPPFPSHHITADATSTSDVVRCRNKGGQKALINSTSMVFRRSSREIVSRGRDLGIDRRGNVFEFCRECCTVFSAEYPYGVEQVVSYFWW